MQTLLCFWNSVKRISFFLSDLQVIVVGVVELCSYCSKTGEESKKHQNAGKEAELFCFVLMWFLEVSKVV